MGGTLFTPPAIRVSRTHGFGCTSGILALFADGEMAPVSMRRPMAKLIGRRRRKRGLAALASEASAERATVGLAVLALGALGVLISGELVRLARRRRESEETDTPGASSTRRAMRPATRSRSPAGGSAPPPSRAGALQHPPGVSGRAIARISTWGIRHGWWPAGNVRVRGRHIHHFIPGIVVAFASGIGAITTRSEKMESTLAIPFGAGMGLTMDEAALLLDLRDVYWTRQGLLSVQVSLGVTATLAATILGLRMLRRGEEKGVEEGLIPQLGTEEIAVTGALT